MVRRRRARLDTVDFSTQPPPDMRTANGDIDAFALKWKIAPP
jgi:hypothetical protein